MKDEKLDVIYNTLIEDINTCIMEYNQKLTLGKKKNKSSK